MLSILSVQFNLLYWLYDWLLKKWMETILLFTFIT